MRLSRSIYNALYISITIWFIRRMVGKLSYSEDRDMYHSVHLANGPIIVCRKVKTGVHYGVTQFDGFRIVNMGVDALAKYAADNRTTVFGAPDDLSNMKFLKGSALAVVSGLTKFPNLSEGERRKIARNVARRASEILLWNS